MRLFAVIVVEFEAVSSTGVLFASVKSSFFAAGANVVVVKNPDNVGVIRGLL